MPLLNWSQEQLQNASTIYRVGVSMGLGTRDIQIALITAMVESGLRNVNYGDRDSLGLFQQRPSQGWGTPEQVMDPVYAARKFYSSLTALGNRRFQMGMGEAAQAVQRSAFPDRYAEHIEDARAMFPTVSKMGGGDPVDLDGAPYKTPADDMLPMPEAPSGPVSLGAAGGLGLDAPQMENTSDPMLGAWGMDVAENTFIGAGTDDLMKQLREEQGPYTKGVNGWRKAVIEAARTAIGTPYVWGGSNLSSGVDCSGLIMAAFQQAGITLPRVSYAQANAGKRVGLKALRPGDLYAWDNSSRNNGADHIALYLGNGMILEAPRPGGVVRIRQLDGDEGGWGVSLNF